MSFFDTIWSDIEDFWDTAKKVGFLDALTGNAVSESHIDRLNDLDLEINGQPIRFTRNEVNPATIMIDRSSGLGIDDSMKMLMELAERGGETGESYHTDPVRFFEAVQRGAEREREEPIVAQFQMERAQHRETAILQREEFQNEMQQARQGYGDMRAMLDDITRSANETAPGLAYGSSASDHIRMAVEGADWMARGNPEQFFRSMHDQAPEDFVRSDAARFAQLKDDLSKVVAMTEDKESPAALATREKAERTLAMIGELEERVGMTFSVEEHGTSVFDRQWSLNHAQENINVAEREHLQPEAQRFADAVAQSEEPLRAADGDVTTPDISEARAQLQESREALEAGFTSRSDMEAALAEARAAVEHSLPLSDTAVEIAGLAGRDNAELRDTVAEGRNTLGVLAAADDAPPVSEYASGAMIQNIHDSGRAERNIAAAEQARDVAGRLENLGLVSLGSAQDVQADQQDRSYVGDINTRQENKTKSGLIL